MEKVKYTNPNDKGAAQKNAEVDIKAIITPKSRALYCQKMGMVDHKCKYNGHLTGIEIKCGCGKVAYNVKPNGNPESHISEIFPKVGYVVYVPELYPEIDYLTESWVFTRQQFIDFLTGYGKPMVKYNTYGNQTDLNIQSFNSKRKQEYLWNTISELPTLADWLEGK